MKKYIIALAILINASLFAQTFSDMEFFFGGDTTNSSWEGELKGNLFYTDLNGTTQYWSKTTPELELQGTYSLQETFSDGDYTTGNAWTVSSGSYAVVDSVGYSGLAKSLRCATAGIIYIPCNQAYGSWAFDWKKASDSNILKFYLINSATDNTTIGLGYNLWIDNSENVYLRRLNAGVHTTLFNTASAYVASAWVTYRDSIVRNTNGSFSVYIKGGTFGDTYTLVSTTGGSGTNPVTDNTYTQSNYFVLDLDAGDMIANIQCEYGMGSMDLNGHEMVKYPYQNSTFEGADTTYFANNGTHSIDTSGTYKYAGSYAGKVVSALGSEILDAEHQTLTDGTSNWENVNLTTFDKAGDLSVTASSNFLSCRLVYGALMTVGKSYRLTYDAAIASGTWYLKDVGDAVVYGQLSNGISQTLDFVCVNANGFMLVDYTAGGIDLDNFSLKQSSGDTTTNFISLAYTQFQPIEAGKKYTFELWLNADSTGTSSTTKPLVYGKLGSKTMWGTATDSISIYAGLFRKFAFTFLATTAEVNTPFKLYFSAARTYYMDNFSLTICKDLMVNVWVKPISKVGFGTYNGNGNGWGININYAFARTANDGITPLASYPSQAFNVWQLLTFTINRTGNITTYYNGVSDGSGSMALLGKMSTETVFEIGRLNGLSSYSNGLTGETQITTFYNIATLDKTPAQIYQRGKNRVHMYDAYTGGEVVGHWFKTPDGTDASGNGNGITSNGGATVSTKTDSY